MPLILQHFATSRACYFYKCSLVFKQTIGHLIIPGVLLLALMTEQSTEQCSSIKFTQPLSLGLRMFAFKVLSKMMVLLLALFSEVNWSLCKQGDANAWLHIEIVFVEQWLACCSLQLQLPNLGFPAVTDCK